MYAVSEILDSAREVIFILVNFLLRPRRQDIDIDMHSPSRIGGSVLNYICGGLLLTIPSGVSTDS